MLTGGGTEVETSPGSFKLGALEADADTVEEAAAKVEPQIPAGARVWCWYNASTPLEDE